MKSISFFKLFCFVIFLLLSIYSCSEDKDVVNAVDVKSFKIIPTEISITVSEIGLLHLEIYPLLATDRNVKWKSSDVSICSVDETGHILGKSIGEVLITATLEQSNLSTSCKIIVKPTIPVNNIFGKPRYLAIRYQEFVLDYTIYPKNASNKEVKLESSCLDAFSFGVDKKTISPNMSGVFDIIISSISSECSKKCEVIVVDRKYEIRSAFQVNKVDLRKGESIFLSTIYKKEDFEINIEHMDCIGDGIKIDNDKNIIYAIETGVIDLILNLNDGSVLKMKVNIL